MAGEAGGGMPPLLIDIGALHGSSCDCALETLHKALAEDPGEDLLWRPHDNPWLTELVDAFTQHGVKLSDAVLQGLLRALAKAGHTKPIGDYAPDDWRALVDLALRALADPAGLEQTAERLAWSAHMAGRFQGVAEILPALASQSALVRVLASIRTGPPPEVVVAERAAWGWAKARIGLHLQGLAEAQRQRVATAVLAHFEEHGMARPGKLRQSLRDAFGSFNRDWRRIAITEAGETANLAYLGQFPAGSRVRRLEAYVGACPFCAKLNGMEFEWVGADHPNKDGWKQVWPGKTNLGRSASPRKRSAIGTLIEREPEERWWPAAGVQHPNCRGRWLLVPDDKPPPGVDPALFAWLEGELEKVRG